MKSLWIMAQAGEELVSDSEELTSDAPIEGSETEMTTEDGSNPPADEPAPQPTMKDMLIQFLPFIAIFVVIFFLFIRGPKKRQQQHQKMVSSIKKNDRIRTIGGIFGTVIDVQDDEIVIKIDESNNTKMKIATGAVAKVLSAEV